MPSRIVYRYLKGGNLRGVTDIEYAEVAKGGWFPKQITRRYYTRAAAATDPNSEQGANVRKKAVVQSVSIGEPVGNDLFDPLIPANTPLVGDLGVGRRTGNTPARASSLMHKEPVKGSTAPARSNSKLLHWIPVSLSLLLVGVCVIGRKRFDM